MDRQWFSPTTYFAVACTAFSVLAVTSAWRNGQAAATAKAQEPVAGPSRPRPTRRRKAVDSVYIASTDQIFGEPYERQSPEDRLRLDALTTLADLIQSAARFSQLLRILPLLQESRITVASLLSELARLTTLLGRLQQAITSKVFTIPPRSTQSACFDATTGSLTGTFSMLEAILEQSESAPGALEEALQQLRDQRPSLDYMMESCSSTPLPPTPPAEPEETLSKEVLIEDNNYLCPFEPSTGLTPAVDAKCWIEPPPEYSPPAPGSIPAIIVEKGDTKSSAPTPPDSQPEVADEVYDHDALYNAVTDDDASLVTQLLALGADPASPIGDLHRTPLHQAAHLNHTASLAVLLRNGALMSTEDAKGDTPLHLAAWSGHVEALTALLAHGADVDWLSGRDGYSPLWCAISAYHIDAARLLLKHGARVSIRSAAGGGLAPLHQAAVTGQSAMCELLLDRGAQVDSRDEDSNTPLHYAAASGSLASVKLLLQSGADVTASQKQGLTPAHWAAHKGHTETLRFLLDCGADVNAVAGEGATPLHMAANRGHVPAVRLLLERGAERNVRDAVWDGVSGTPASMAKAKGHVRVVRLLKAQ